MGTKVNPRGFLPHLPQNGSHDRPESDTSPAGKVPEGLGKARFNHVKLKPTELVLCLKNAG